MDRPKALLGKALKGFPQNSGSRYGQGMDRLKALLGKDLPDFVHT
ncbi:hypothetical protein [Burkholderia sp. WTPI3]|nr:hypothetical protein [Burkholderia sp. WTPI3]